MRLNGVQGRSEQVWRRENLLHPPGFEPRIIQHVASRYTDYVISHPHLQSYFAYPVLLRSILMLYFIVSLRTIDVFKESAAFYGPLL
jgi:hypothetical protein